MELIAKQVIKMSDGKDRKSEALADALRAIDPKISSVSLGNFIRRFKGRIVNGLRFAKCVGARDGSAKWKVEKVE